MKKFVKGCLILAGRMCGTWRCGMRDRTGIRSRNGRIAAGIS